MTKRSKSASMQLTSVDIKTEHIVLGGGMNLVSPALDIPAGALIACENYEAGTTGGYKRIDGYERYDGHPAPSDAVYYFATTDVDLTDLVSVGDILTGAISGASGVVSRIVSDHINLTKVTGTFQAEDVTKSGTVVGAFILAPTENGEKTAYEDAISTYAAAEQYRSDISAPSGSGPIRGLAMLRGSLYCFRDNTAGTAGQILKATSSGWIVIPLYHEIDFNTGVSEIADGTTITLDGFDGSGATATVKRTVLESGAWGTDASGRLILSNISGTFNGSGVIKVSGVTRMTAASLATQISILPGGRYETFVYNFYSSLDTQRIYGADGVNRGFEFDGTVYVPINTGMTSDKPEYVYGHKNQLFFSFKGSLQNSGVGYPYQWTALSGASEIGMGDDITGLVSLTGSALGVLSRNSSRQLLGNNIDDFELQDISNEVGCIPRTSQRIGYSYCLDDRGVILIAASDTYGNFEQSTISRLVQPLIDNIRQKVSATAVYRQRNQYRIYGNDGSGICMTIMDEGFAFTSFRYPVNVACALCAEDSTGKDVVFLGSDTGMVYQADKGSSFDGAEIESYIQLPFNNSNYPSYLKTYRKASIEMSAQKYAEIMIAPDFSYSDPNLPAHRQEVITTTGEGGYWNNKDWDTFFYDAQVVTNHACRITGSGNNIGFIIYSNNNFDFGHKIEGLLLQYTLRRLIR